VIDGFNYGLSLIVPLSFGYSFTLDSSKDINVSSIMLVLLSSLTTSTSVVS
jgi:hypothetical protein